MNSIRIRWLRQWFGTTSSNHPGVKRFFAAGDWAIGGSVTLVSPLASALKPYEISPTDSRYIFEHNGWSRVVGFHTRNVCHRAHEFLQNTALETANADGIYISPVTGTKKANDFLPEPVIRSYEMLLNAAPDEANTRMLGAFSPTRGLPDPERRSLRRSAEKIWAVAILSSAATIPASATIIPLIPTGDFSTASAKSA